jgi:NAD(P)-dependent dehydrogenase (short-subunit alcohol dehydrogenase family)
VLKRYGKPDEVAAAMRCLLGSGASYITGTALSVDGGDIAGNNLESHLS